jgi:hypothetical protein
MIISHAQRWAALVAATCLVTLAACGGGGGTEAPAAQAPSTGGAVPSAQASTVSGTITGFGSVIIDGKKYDDSATSVSIGNDPKVPEAGSLTDLKLGMHVEGMITDGKLISAVVQAALSGAVSGVDAAAGTLVVMGQTVKVVSTGATPTVFDGVSDLSGLLAGDVVEVHGTLDANRVVNATRIERKPRSDASKPVRLSGVIASLDTTAKTFKLNDMTVDYGVASLLPAGVALANGQVFTAIADLAPAAGIYRPKTISIAKPGEGSAFELSGRVMAFASLADFTVSGIRVDGSGATLESGAASDLALGVVVAASGTVTDGVLKAKSLRVLKTSVDVAASLAGQVTEFVSSASFKVRGTVVDASTSGVVFIGGTAADLGNGAWLVVKGKVSGDVLKADSIDFQSPPAAKPVTLKGEIRDLDATTGVFHFLGFTLKLGAGVEWVGGTLANLANGKRVEVTGIPGTDGVVLVSKLSFLGDLAPTPSVLGGRVSDLSGGQFKLSAISVQFVANTVFEGGASTDLSNGVQVLAKGLVNGGTKVMTATWIQIVPADLPGVRVSGAMNDFVSIANFRVGGQRVDASTANFSDGVAADLANGRVLDVRGSVVKVDGNTVVKATEVRFLNK